MLPNLFLIGAPKCGTTSLHFYLDQHPEISMCATKEPHVFSFEDWPARLGAYDDQFDAGARWRGDASTSYSTYPMHGDVAGRIHHAEPDACLLYLVADPVQRAVSQYVQARLEGREDRPVDVAFADFENPRNWYVCTSRYAMQAERYLERFPSNRLLVIDSDELRRERMQTLGGVFRFLEVDPGFSSSRFDSKLGRSSERVRFGTFGGRLQRSVAGRAFRRLPPDMRAPFARAARRMLGTPIETPQLDPWLHARLGAFLRDDVEGLRRMTGKRFEHWSV